MKQQNKISMGQRIGHFFLALLPLIVFIMTQIIASFIFMLIAEGQMIIMAVRAGNFTSTMMEYMQMKLQVILTEHLMEINLIYQMIALAIFGTWYYFMVVYRKKVSTNKAFGIQAIIGIPLFGFGVEIAISFFLGIFSLAFPKVMQDYMELMNEAGLDEVTPLIAVATVIMAPLVEELVFRGVTLYYAQKMTRHFWIANVFQAILFGIGHMNLVQGCYAFVLGVVMGCIYYKYRSLKATILLHAGFNLVGTIVSGIADSALEQNNMMMALTLELVLILSGIIGLTLILTDHKKEQT